MGLEPPDEERVALGRARLPELRRRLVLVRGRRAQVERRLPGHLYERGRTLHEGAHHAREPGPIRRHGQPFAREERLEVGGEPQRRSGLDPVMGEPLELGGVEDRARLADMGQVELPDQVLGREDLLVAV